MTASMLKKLMLATSIYCISLVGIADIIPGIPDVPKIPAFLPTMDQVPASQPMPIDGTWLLPTIGKKIRIDSGRAYAIDSWLHLFVLDIQPGMVVWKDIVPTGPGQYGGEDLPLMGRFTAKVGADRSMSVSVAGMLGPVTFKAIPIQLNNDHWYSQEMQAAGLGGQQFNGQRQGNYQMSPPPGQQFNNNQQQYNPQQSYRQQPPNGWQQQNNNNQQGNWQQNNGNNSHSGQYQTQYNPNNPNNKNNPNQYQPNTPVSPPSGQSQSLNISAETSSEEECEETVYDPDTDTSHCYTEGEDE